MSHPFEFLGNVGAFVIFVIVCSYAVLSYLNGNSINISNIDKVTLGYFDDPTPVIITANTNNFESQQLYLDCIEALKSLGMKRSEAKKITKDIFQNHNPSPTSIESFLMIALRK
jgi:hypothetical protein